MVKGRGSLFYRDLIDIPNPLAPLFIDTELFGNPGFPLVRFKRDIPT